MVVTVASFVFLWIGQLIVLLPLTEHTVQKAESSFTEIYWQLIARKKDQKKEVAKWS